MKSSALRPEFPQPLLTRDQLFQIRAAGTFEIMRRVQALAQSAEEAMDGACERFYSTLPMGYRTLPYGGNFPHGELRLAAVDGAGNDVKFPCTRFEAWLACWEHSGQPTPKVLEDAGYLAAKAIHGQLTTWAAELRRKLDEIHAATPEPQVG